MRVRPYLCHMMISRPGGLVGLGLADHGYIEVAARNAFIDAPSRLD